MNAQQLVRDTANRPLATTPAASKVGQRLVVGVGGSEKSIEALRWAARIASAIGISLEVITTWEPRLGTAGPSIASLESTYIRPEDDAQASLTRLVDAAYGHDRPPNLTLTAREGDASHLLIEERKTAPLLMIGSRGLSEVAELLLGSVGAQCAESALCPA